MRSIRAGLAVLLAASAVVVTGPTVSAAAETADCVVKPGGAAEDLWPQRRLDFQQVWGITRGQGVTVAVVDSGVTFTNPQLSGSDHSAGVTVIPGLGAPTHDCVGHGTGVAGIIAAQPVASQAFLGVAPDVRIVPIKVENTADDRSGSADLIAAGIRAALAAKAQVATISVVTDRPTTALARAVAAARARGMIIVAAAGNDGKQTRTKLYPAAYSTTEDNVIAVSATDSNDAIADFSGSGGYVTVAAPGKDVAVPSTLGGYSTVTGTSYAAAYVTGTVALMLSAATLAGKAPLTPLQVRDRIEATADAPPADVPDPTYGYGIVNPLLAVTALQSRPAGAPASAKASALPAPHAAAPADRDLQHVALGLASGLIGLAVLALVATGILRGGARRSGVRAEPAVRSGAGPVPEPDSGPLVRR